MSNRKHRVILHKDFLENFEKISDDDEIKAQMALIIVGLQNDPFYKPDEASYVFEQISGVEYSCQHINGWEGWSLAWFFEYPEDGRLSPEAVVVQALPAPAVRLRRKR